MYDLITAELSRLEKDNPTGYACVQAMLSPKPAQDQREAMLAAKLSIKKQISTAPPIKPKVNMVIFNQAYPDLSAYWESQPRLFGPLLQEISEYGEDILNVATIFSSSKALQVITSVLIPRLRKIIPGDIQEQIQSQALNFLDTYLTSAVIGNPPLWPIGVPAAIASYAIEQIKTPTQLAMKISENPIALATIQAGLSVNSQSLNIGVAIKQLREEIKTLQKKADFVQQKKSQLEISTWYHHEFEQGIEIGALMLKYLGQKPETVQKIKGAAVAINNIFQASRLVQFGQMSIFAFGGCLVTTFSALSNLILGTPHFENACFLELKAEISELRSTMQSGLIFLSHQQQRILQMLEVLLQGQRNIVSALQIIQRDFNIFVEEQRQQGRADAIKILKGFSRGIKTIGLGVQSTGLQDPQKMFELFSNIVTYAITTSKEPQFAGARDLPSTLIHERQYLNLSFNLLNQLLQELDINVYVTTRIANPIEWERATNYWMQGLAYIPELVRNPGIQYHVNELWRVGIELATFIQDVSSNEIISYLMKQYQKQGQVIIEKIKSTIKKYRDDNQFETLKTITQQRQLQATCRAGYDTQFDVFEKISMALLCCYQLNLLRQQSIHDEQAFIVAWDLGMYKMDDIFAIVENEIIKQPTSSVVECDVAVTLERSMQQTIEQIEKNMGKDIPLEQNIPQIMLPLAMLANIANLQGVTLAFPAGRKPQVNIRPTSPLTVQSGIAATPAEKQRYTDIFSQNIVPDRFGEFKTVAPLPLPIREALIEKFCENPVNLSLDELFKDIPPYIDTPTGRIYIGDSLGRAQQNYRFFGVILYSCLKALERSPTIQFVDLDCRFSRGLTEILAGSQNMSGIKGTFFQPLLDLLGKNSVIQTITCEGWGFKFERSEESIRVLQTQQLASANQKIASLEAEVARLKTQLGTL